MQYPLIHLNGTDGDSLLADQCDIARVLREAIEVMSQNGPNARDYYPLEAGAYERARAEHFARMASVQAVLKDVEHMAEYLAADPHAQLEMRKA
jgi:hypothetical protein